MMISYVLIAGIVLINIVVAVLLDEFISSVTREKNEAQDLARYKSASQLQRPTLTPIPSILHLSLARRPRQRRTSQVTEGEGQR